MARFAAAFNDFLWNDVGPTRGLTDPRKQPRIKLETIVGSVILLPLAGARSLLEIDLRLRDGARRYFGESVSDTHLTRVIGQLDLEELRIINRRVSEQGGGYRLESGRELNIGLVDGTSLGKHLVSAFQTVRSAVDRPLVDLEPSPGQGHELATTARLINRVVHKTTRAWHLIGADGLYMTQGHMRQCLELGVDFFVKTKEGTLTIVQEAKEIFRRKHLYSKDVECVEGADEKRHIRWRVIAGSGFSFEGVDRELRVAWVEETSTATGETETFFVVTSRLDLTAEELRELGHLRWSIENHGFKLFNSLYASKHGYIKDEAASLRLVFLLAIGFNSLLRFLQTKRREIDRHWRTAKVTLRNLARFVLGQLLRASRMIRAES